MKQILLFALLLWCHAGWAQSNNKSTKQMVRIVDNNTTNDSVSALTPPVEKFNSTKETDDNTFTVISVKVEKDKFFIKYFEGKEVKEDTVPIGPDVVIRTSKRGLFSFSLLTVPFKIRPAILNQNQIVKTDIKNIGLFIGPYAKWTNYFFDGTSSDHKIAMGLVISPGAEELNSNNTNGVITSAHNQLILSTSFAITYTYKSITLGVIPIGFDHGLNSEAKHWIYNQKYWWGFGIGLDSKFFGF